MPSLGADRDAGTLVEWLKRPGDRVKRGDVVAVVETQKGAIQVDVFEYGVIERWLVEPGTTVPVGTPLVLIGGGSAATGAPEIAAAMDFLDLVTALGERLQIDIPENDYPNLAIFSHALGYLAHGLGTIA
jgi:pyruvate/2-oxoglutarate dehydrogenase complex dihydrolipoamide acyltransferase (E2) component